MQPNWNILWAKCHCSYKAWQLAKATVEIQKLDLSNKKQEPLMQLFGKEAEFTIHAGKITLKDKLVIAAICYLHEKTTGNSIEVAKVYYGTPDNSEKGQSLVTKIRAKQYTKQAEKLLSETLETINSDTPPAFYRNSHCPECQFWGSCYEKLKERDCISLLGGISEKILKKYHSRGFFSILQLSHTFRPRRRRQRSPQLSGSFLWELKALAIREQKTFVLHPPNIIDSQKAIYIDFEGIPDEGWVYLIGGIIKEEGKPDEVFSYWADDKENEKEIFCKLISLLTKHPDTPIYHYGSYETTALRHVSKKLSSSLKMELNESEKKMVNLLSYLRTHVYPPTYSNGLKEVANFLGFNWKLKEADGKRSILWRKEWELTKDVLLKERLLQYNMDDCFALSIVKEWFYHLAIDTKQEDIQQVSQMKRHSPFKFQNNPEFGEDYKIISRAAYFDYQRSKIYWRNQKGKTPGAVLRIQQKKRHLGRGIVFWKPKKVDEIILIPPLKKCPFCGNKKLYHLGKTSICRQTDIKFTSTGSKQHIVEYRSGSIRCAKCLKKSSYGNIRKLHYGNNLFAWVINLYVNYHISHYLISRIVQEQFGIWMNPMYLIMTKQRWWKNWKPEADYLWQIVRNSPVIHIDETTVKLSKERGYVWVFATPHTVFYHLTLNRETGFLQEWLKDYKGIIITDSFPGYETIPVKRQKCLIHIIRDLNDDLYKNPFDDEYKVMVEAFGKLLRDIIETIDHYGLQEKHLRKHKIMTEQFYKLHIDCIHKSELSVKYSKRLQKHWDELWTFLHQDNVPWNNNNAEAAVKAFALHRRGVNGQVNARGISEYLEMLSIAQTCRYRNISFLDFLRRKVGIWDNIQPSDLPGFLPFTQARLFINKQGFQNKDEWVQWNIEGKKPLFIPSCPDEVYKDKGWIDWNDWLGSSFLPFNKARTYMRKLGLRNRKQYMAWMRNDKCPKFIPSNPEEVYNHMGWNGMEDWLGIKVKQKL